MRVSERDPGDVAELQRRVKTERNALQRDRYPARWGWPWMDSRPRRSPRRWAARVAACRIGFTTYRDGGVEELRPGKSPADRTKLACASVRRN